MPKVILQRPQVARFVGPNGAMCFQISGAEGGGIVAFEWDDAEAVARAILRDVEQLAKGES